MCQQRCLLQFTRVIPPTKKISPEEPKIKESKKTEAEELKEKTKIAAVIPAKIEEKPETKEKKKKWYQFLINELDFSDITKAALKKKGLKTTKEIDQRKDNELLAIKGIGKKTLAEIRKTIQRLKVRYA